ncbi:MAG: PIN domain-containing protein [Candidatus Rokuibacteriota bacterium]
MQEGRVVDLDTSIALRAAKLSAEHSLPLADSIILATTRAYDAVLWTQDADFRGLPKIRFRARAT